MPKLIARKKEAIRQLARFAININAIKTHVNTQKTIDQIDHVFADPACNNPFHQRVRKNSSD